MSDPLIQTNISLRPFNTLGIDVKARYFLPVSDIEQLKTVLASPPCEQMLPLGGGSNLVFRRSFEGLILHNRLRGIQLIASKNDHVTIRVGAGENWDDLVGFCVRKGWYGLENLSAIPGFVGAAPIQNIGAYGVEVKDAIDAVHGVYLENGKPFQLAGDECQFGYRDSVFKRELTNQTVITALDLTLSKVPQLNLNYGGVRQQVALAGYSESTLTAEQLREVITALRAEKLPDPAQYPNVGSFFKNPVVSAEVWQHLKQNFPNMVAYPQINNQYKLAAGWLIDSLGWKGRRCGDARVHDRQALVLINEGRHSEDVLRLASEIQARVDSEYGVQLEIEPGIIG